MGVPVSLQTPVVALGAVDELPDLHRTRPCEGRKSGVQAGMSVSATVAEPTLCGGTHSSSSLGQMQGDAGRLARLSGRWGVGVPWSRLGAKRACGGSEPSERSELGEERGAGHTTLSPTPLFGIGYPRAPKHAALSLGLPSCRA